MSSSMSNRIQVCDYMEAHMITYKFRGQPQKFFPQSDLNLITSKATIKCIIARDDQPVLSDSDLNEFVDRVHHSGRQLFAICVYCDASMDYLKAMLDNGLTDAKLPLGENDFGSLGQKRMVVKSFIANQKHFQTVFFADNSIRHLDDRIADRFSIPIDHEESDANFKGRGAFGAVWKVKIHPDHRSFSCGTNTEDYFAMKVTQHEGREQNYHRAMAGLKHPHLVKCLASFTLGAKYQMIYELATCDLEDFIQRHPLASKVSGLTDSWLAQQLFGLAGALQVVHNPEGARTPTASNTLSVPSAYPGKTGYIHDIKPENILVFTYNGTNNWLRLSDFSCARVVEFVATISGKRDSYKTGTKSGTPIYRAPESDGATSRPYDMWSLGCVYLELLVWFVEGYAALEDFRASREGHVRPDGLIDEGFYHQTDSGVIQLREAVTTKIETLSRRCSNSLRDIVKIVPQLLKIKPTERLNASQLVHNLKHLNTGLNLIANTRKSLGGLAVPNFASSHLPAQNEKSEFDDRVKITRPSDG